MWFFYFSRLTSQARSARSRMYRGPDSGVPGFSDIATFFAVCVWLAPLFLFLSLSAGENALPTAGGKNVFHSVGEMISNVQIFSGFANSPSTPPQIHYPQTRGSLFKTLVDALPLDRFPRMRPATSRSSPEGIIAPPLKSPSLHSDGPPSPYLRTLNDLVPPSPGIPRHSSDTFPPSFQLAPPPRRSSNAFLTSGPGSNRLNIRRATMPVNGIDKDS
jgi:hypothetical protein